MLVASIGKFGGTFVFNNDDHRGKRFCTSLNIKRMKPKTQPGISVRAIHPVIKGLENFGHDVSTILIQLGISNDDLKDIDKYPPHNVMMRFWEVIGELTSDSCIGLHAAEAVTLDVMTLGLDDVTDK